MERSFQFHWVLSLQPQGLQHHPQTYWHIRIFFSSVPRISKLRRLTTREERDTKHCVMRAHNPRQQGGCPTYRLGSPKTWKRQSLVPSFKGELSSAFNHLGSGKSTGLESIFPEFIFHAGSTLKSWLCDFFTSWICQSEFPGFAE